MFSGKTTEVRTRQLIRRIRINQIRDSACLIVKTPDARYNSIYEIVTHDQARIKAQVCSSLSQIAQEASNYQVIGIDEGQFFPDLVKYCEAFADDGKVVIVAALDADYRRSPFGEVCSLMAKAEQVTKLSSVCYYCKSEASFSVRISGESSQKVVGGLEKYRAACRSCYHAVNTAS
jgi:thymidine kinase